MAAIDFQVRVHQQVSGNGVAGVGAMRDALGRLHDSQGRYISETRAMGSATGALSPSLSSVGSVLRSVATGALVATAAFVGVAAAAIKVGVDVAGAASRMESLQMGLNMVAHSAEAGGEAMEFAFTAAQRYGLGVESTAQSMRKLLAAQFSMGAAKDIVRMSADMKALGADAQEVESVIRAITQIKGKGKLQAEELVGQLGEAGISASLVYDELGKIMGKTSAEVQKLITAGKVDADTGILAIQNAVKAKLGIEQLGDAADAASQTLAGTWARLKSSFEAGFLKTSMDAIPALSRLKPVIESVIDLLQGGKGGAIGSAITEAIGTVVDVVMDLATPANLKAMVATFRDLVAVVPKVVAVVRSVGSALSAVGSAFASGVQDGFTMFGASAAGAAPALSSLATSLVRLAGHFGTVVGVVGTVISAALAFSGAIWSVVGPLLKFAASVGTAVGQLFSMGSSPAWATIKQAAGELGATFSSIGAWIGGALASAGAAIAGVASQIGGWVSGAAAAAASAASSLGSGIVNGIISGIQAGASAVVSAIVGVATSALSAAKGALGIASPSKLFADQMGAPIAGGVAAGIDQGQSAVGASVVRLVKPPPQGASMAAGAKAGAAASGGKGGGSITIGTITINGVADAADAADKLRDALAELLAGLEPSAEAA